MHLGLRRTATAKKGRGKGGCRAKREDVEKAMNRRRTSKTRAIAVEAAKHVSERQGRAEKGRRPAGRPTESRL